MIDREFGDRKKSAEKEMNAKTIATIKHSIKNHDKLKSFDNVDDAMKWLTSNDEIKKSSAKKTN